MATVVRATVYDRQPPDWAALEAELARLAWLHDHRGDGQLALLNTHGEATVDPALRQTIDVARDVAAASDGAFDPTVLPLTELWQFDSGGVVPADDALAAATQRVDWRRVTLTASEVRLGAGARLDLGAVAKGAVVDRLGDWLEARDVGTYLLEAGGDLLVAGEKPDRTPWRVWVRHPRDSAAPLTVLEVSPGDGRVGVVTSGDYERGLEVDGVRYHHILDPRTGYPARPMVSVTVLAESAAAADAYATALFVLGPERAREVARRSPVDALLVWPTEDGAGLQAWRTAGMAQAAGPLTLN